MVGTIFFIVLITVIIFGYRRYKSYKQFGERFKNLGSGLGLTFVGTGASSGSGYAEYNFRTRIANLDVHCMLAPGSKGSYSILGITIEAPVRYTASLLPADGSNDGDAIAGGTLRLEEEVDTDIAISLRHPVVEALLVRLGSRPVDRLELSADGLAYRERLGENQIYTENVRDAMGWAAKLALYLSRPDHLDPVKSVETMISMLSVMVEDAGEVDTDEEAAAKEEESIGVPDIDEPEDAIVPELSPVPAVAEVPYEEIANPEPESALETETDAENMSTAELVSAISAGNLTADDTARIIAGRGDAAINELVKCLSEYRDRDNARAVLAAIGAAAVPGLVGNLNDYRLRSEIEKLMDDLDQEGATALMGELGRIEDRDVLCRILVTVGKLGPPGAQEEIEPFLNSDDYRIKYEAERALRSLGLDYAEIEKIKKAQ